MKDTVKRFDVVEILVGPHAGKICVLPTLRRAGRLRLRNARYRMCNSSFDFADGFADGFATGLICAKREGS
jgi:hypothetical protein